MRKLFYFSIWACSLISSLQADEVASLRDFTVDLKDPIFTNGVVSTDKGGVITGEGLRIQARSIAYINRTENGIHLHTIQAEGDLLLQYGNQAFVGRRLEYDCVTRSGTIFDGKTFVDVWYLGGEKILLQSDGSYSISNGYVTTSESQNALWELHAGKVKITDDYRLKARDIKLNFVQLPFFWLPGLYANLRFFRDSPIHYKVKWDKQLGPRISARYRVYSWEDLQVFLRADYRVGHGGGGALETEYRTEDGRTESVTRSYGSIDDKSTPIQLRHNQYRLQGLYRTLTRDNRTSVYLTYDKISDEKMIGEFRSDDFEINTQKRTRLFIDHKEDTSFINFRLQPRINWWQSLNQELPTLTIGLKPFTFGSSGIIMQNWMNASYLDYVYATNLHQYISNTHSGRLQTVNQLYRPIPLSYFTLTPEVGIDAIYYSNNPHHQAIGQLIGTYGLLMDTRLTRNFEYYTHVMRPYASFRGSTKPLASTNSHFYFSIDDGLNKINTLRLGVQNSFYKRKTSNWFLPSINTDVYTYGFYGSRGYLSTFPRLYTDIDLDFATQKSRIGFGWNMQKRVVDFINLQLAWTVNQNLAFVVEMRHRSRFDWRKSDHHNFIVDVSRPLNQLVESPLSDGRNTLLSQVQLRLHPLWTCHISSHAGWGRRNEPAYHSEKIDFYTMIATSWRLRVSMMFSPADIRFDWGINLVE